MKEKKIPAFPTQKGKHYGFGTDDPGMTLRDYFAAKAMQGLLGNLAIQDKFLAIKQREYWLDAHGDVSEAEAISKEAYLMADAMLNQRTKQ